MGLQHSDVPPMSTLVRHEHRHRVAAVGDDDPLSAAHPPEKL
jgi:hypothetical protein